MHGKRNQEWHKLNLSMCRNQINKILKRKKLENLFVKRFIDFDHEVRFNVEHLNETDKKLITEVNDNNEPKKKKFKVNKLSVRKNLLIYILFSF